MNEQSLPSAGSKRFTQIGLSSFESFVQNKDAIFVDKTSFIQAVITGTAVMLFTRPRRWGKTLNMSMLEYFFSVTVKSDASIDTEKQKCKYDIFSKMNIGQYQETMDNHCAKYPVIFLTFKEVKGTSYAAIESQVRHLIYQLYATHKYLLNSNKLDEINKRLFNKYLSKEFDIPEMTTGIFALSEMLYIHFDQNVVVLIDEYDAPINDWYARKLAAGDKIENEYDKYLEEVLILFRGLFSAGLKDNKYLEKGVVTGILRVAKANLFSGINNLTEDSILNKRYSSYFGFTEGEVSNLVKRSGMESDERMVNDMRSWYNGYNIGETTIYNPWSIMNWLNYDGEFAPYWVGTASTTLLENAIMLDTFQEEVQRFIEGNEITMIANPHMVFSDITSSHNAFYNLLLFSGYLTVENVESNEDGSYTCDARIPNREVRGIFTGNIQKWVRNKLGIEVDQYSLLINALLEGNIELFTTNFKKYLQTSMSYHSTGQKNAEIFYNGFMLCLVSAASNKYFVEAEKESGSGRADLMLIPKSNAKHRNAIIMEFKSVQKQEVLPQVADQALEQIKEKNYVSKIRTYENVSRTIGVGLAFCGKDVEIVSADLLVTP